MSRDDKLLRLSGLSAFELKLARLLWPGLDRTMTVEGEADYYKRSWAQMPEMSRVAQLQRTREVSDDRRD